MLRSNAPASLTVAPSPGERERPFWLQAGATWRQLAGNFDHAGFSFEWHEWTAPAPLNWAGSFHPNSIEICLNLSGSAWVGQNQQRIQFSSQTAGFFAVNGNRLAGQRNGGEKHQFLSVEFALPFLRTRLGNHTDALHPVVRRSLAGKRDIPFSEVAPISQRQRDLLNSLLHPPVLRAAQRLWFESKALEFAAEFFFADPGTELLCNRAQRLARERVAKAKAILATNLDEPPGLDELGRLVACSPYYLSRTFTRETGRTISQYLRQIRLERAAELLRSGSCNVTEAALQVGYSSLSHFSQAFHERFGCCPGLYPLRTPSQRPKS